MSNFPNQKKILNKQSFIKEDINLNKKVDSVVNEIVSKINSVNQELKVIDDELSGIRANQLMTRCVKLTELANNYDFYYIKDDETLSYLLTKSKVEEINEYDTHNNYLVISNTNSENEISYSFVFYDKNTWDRIHYFKYKGLQDFALKTIPSSQFEKKITKGFIRQISKSSNEEYLFKKFDISPEICELISKEQTLRQDSIILSKNKQDIFGFTYVGQVKNNIREGYGILINLFQDTIFKGIWKDDMIENGNFYAFHEFYNGNCKDGFGCEVYNDGSVYLGNFRNAKSNGSGEYFSSCRDNAQSVYIKGECLDGQFVMSRSIEKKVDEQKKETEILIVGRKANGNLRLVSKLKSKDGFHKEFRYYTHGQIFFGKQNELVKDGVIYYTNGDLFIGTDSLTNGIDGIGKYVTSGGEVQTGQFVNSNLSGMGTIIKSNGILKEGLFEKGVLVKTKEQLAQDEKDLQLYYEQRQVEMAQKRQDYPERECSSCHKQFCCQPGYQFEENGEITSNKNYVTNYCSSECAKKGYKKLDGQYQDAKNINQYKNEKCDSCYGHGTVNCFNNFGETQKCRCTSCNGTGKKYNK